MNRSLKSILVLGLVFLLTFSLAACSSSTPAPEDNQGESENEAEASFEFTEPINLVVVFGPGSTGDVFSRELARIAEKYTGQQIIVVNKEGGSGSVGMKYMLQQPADGHTIAYHSNTFAFTMASGQLDMQPSDILPLANMAGDFHVLSVLADDDRFQTWEDVVEYAKANPGQLNMGGAQVRGNNHVFTLHMMLGADLEANYVPYDNGGKSALGLLGGNVDTLSSTSSTVRQQLENGDFRALAVTCSDRSPDYPDVPTFAELGIDNLDGYISWKGFFANPDIPDTARDKWDEVFKSVAEDPEWKEFLEKDKQIHQYMDSETFTEYFSDYVAEGVEVFEQVEIE